MGKFMRTLYLSRGDAALGWIASATDMVKLMIKYKTFESLHDNINVARARSLADTAKADDGYNFDWYSTDSTGDWWQTFQFLGSSNVMMHSSDGFCCAVLINTFRPDNLEFFPELIRVIKMVNSDWAIRYSVMAVRDQPKADPIASWKKIFKGIVPGILLSAILIK